MDSVQNRIARRAYNLFVARGGQHGYHIEDWLKAEKDILAEKATPAPKKKKAPVKKVAKSVAKKKAAPVAKKKTTAKKK